jgi:hypothetical protein
VVDCRRWDVMQHLQVRWCGLCCAVVRTVLCAALCCPVISCALVQAALCCAVLCCAVLCRAVL